MVRLSAKRLLRVPSFQSAFSSTCTARTLTERQNYISRQLKSITRELGIAGVVIHSFNKEGLKADVPDLDNASQGADIMYDCDKALFIVDHVPEPGQFKNDCVKTFIFRKSRRKVKQTIFHLVSSPDVPGFHPLSPLVQPKGVKP